MKDKKRYVLEMSNELWGKLRNAAKAAEISIADLIRQAIKEFLERKEGKEN